MWNSWSIFSFIQSCPTRFCIDEFSPNFLWKFSMSQSYVMSSWEIVSSLRSLYSSVNKWVFFCKYVSIAWSQVAFLWIWVSPFLGQCWDIFFIMNVLQAFLCPFLVLSCGETEKIKGTEEVEGTCRHASVDPSLMPDCGRFYGCHNGDAVYSRI